jgi:acetyl-CoA acetyltransferase
MSISGRTAIVGASEVDTFQTSGRSPVGLMAVAAKRALDDAGLTVADVDGLFTSSSYYAMPTLTLGEYLGVRPRFVDSTGIGGCSFIAHLAHAAAAIEAGLCEVALVAYGSTQRSDRGKLVSMAEWLPYEQPYGLIHPVSAFGMIAHRHMAEYGTTSEQLAQVAVSAREWALRTPDAPYREPLTVDDVLASPMIASPLHKLDCCLVTDGGGAVVVTSAEQARDLRRDPVYLVGAGEAQNHRNISQMPDLTATVAAETADRAFAMAGLGRADVDTLHVYDAFTISLLVLLEDLGFCKKGEGGAFVGGGRLRFDTPGPALNTDGGGLSSNHPGMRGIFLVIEAVKQLRGECDARQVEAARLACVHGTGGTLGVAHSGATLILGTEP